MSGQASRHSVFVTNIRALRRLHPGITASNPRYRLKVTGKGPGCFSAAFAGTASAQGNVTAGGTLHIVGGISDHDDGVDGIESFYNRIVVGYSNALENGLEIGGRLAVFVENDSSRFYNPGESFVTIGGGFGTIALGNHVTAVHATVPFPILTPDSPHWGHQGMFSGLSPSNGPGLWPFFGITPNGISYSTPTMGGLVAMVTFAPHADASQNNQIKDVVKADYKADNIDADDYMAAAIKYSGNMGGMDIALGVGMQTAEDDMVDSIVASGTLGVGGATLAASWHDNGDDGTEGITLSAKYTIGAIAPAIAYGQLENEDGGDESYLVVGSSYNVGGGLSAFAEYIALEVEDDDETILLSGVRLDF